MMAERFFEQEKNMKKYRILSLAVITLFVLSGICIAGKNKKDRADMRVPVMTAVPSGTFSMGQVFPNGLRLGFPVHEVTLTRDFEIGKYEVTNEEFCSILNYALDKKYLSGDYKHNITVMNREGSSEELLDMNGAYKGIRCAIRYEGKKFVVEEGQERRPVVYVSWCGAAFYCNMLSEFEGLEKLYDLTDWSCRTYAGKGYRLPTESEWEYCARYDDGRIFPWGNQYDDSLLNYNLNTGHTTDVGSYENGKSKLGLYDMAGNAEEWVNDWYGSYTPEPKTDPAGIADGVYKEKRGGSWYRDDNNFACAAYRYDTNYIYTSFFDIGFRVVRTGQPGKE